jgi:hypothetical protein
MNKAWSQIHGKRRIFGLSNWSSPQAMLNRCRVFGYTQFHSGDLSIFIVISRRKTLSCIKYRSYNIALSRIESHRIIHYQGREMTFSVRKFVTNGALNRGNFSLKCVFFQEYWLPRVFRQKIIRHPERAVGFPLLTILRWCDENQIS